MCPHLGSPEKLSGQLGSNPSTWIVSPALPQASYIQQPAPFTTRRSPTTLRDGGHMAASRYFPVIAVLSSLDVPARSVLERLRRERGRNVCRRAINDARYAKNRGRKRPRGNLAGGRLSRAPLRGRAIASGCAPSRHRLRAISSSLSALSFHDTRCGRDPGTRVWSTPQKLNHNKIDSLC